MYTMLAWDYWYQLAKTYYEHHGNLKINQHFKTFNGYDYDESGYKLGAWLNNQKSRYKKGFLTEEQKQKLELLGVDFKNTQDFRWNRMYELVQNYYQHYGHLKIDTHFRTFNGYDYDENGYKLGAWFNNQRRSYKNGELFQERAEKLKKIGVVLGSIRDDNWSKMYEFAQKYYEHKGHLKIPARFKTENGYEYSNKGKGLGPWIVSQRKLYANGLLSQQQIDKLNQIGMLFENVHDKEWERVYCLAKAYYEHYGNLRVKPSFKTKDGYTYHEQGYCLGNWLYTQRMMYKKNILSEERIKKLQLIGMLFVIKKNTSENISVCEECGIDYKQNRLIIDSIAYRELVAKINYLKSLEIPLTINNQLHPIFAMGNINMQARYGISLERLLAEYSNSKAKTKMI